MTKITAARWNRFFEIKKHKAVKRLTPLPAGPEPDLKVYLRKERRWVMPSTHKQVFVPQKRKSRAGVVYGYYDTMVIPK